MFVLINGASGARWGQSARFEKQHPASGRLTTSRKVEFYSLRQMSAPGESQRLAYVLLAYEDRHFDLLEPIVRAVVSETEQHEPVVRGRLLQVRDWQQRDLPHDSTVVWVFMKPRPNDRLVLEGALQENFDPGAPSGNWTATLDVAIDFPSKAPMDARVTDNVFWSHRLTHSCCRRSGFSADSTSLMISLTPFLIAYSLSESQRTLNRSCRHSGT